MEGCCSEVSRRIAADTELESGSQKKKKETVGARK